MWTDVQHHNKYSVLHFYEYVELIFFESSTSSFLFNNTIIMSVGELIFFDGSDDSFDENDGISFPS